MLLNTVVMIRDVMRKEDLFNAIDVRKNIKLRECTERLSMPRERKSV